MILITFIKFYKISAPSPYTDNKVAMQFRMFLCIEQLFPVQGVQLQLMSSLTHIVADQHRKLFNCLLIAEDTFIKFNRQRASVYDIFQHRLAE